MAAQKKVVWNIIKFLLSAVAIYFAFQLIDPQAFRQNLAKTNIGWVIAGLVLYIISQVISSKRLQLILKTQGTEVPFMWNLELYFVGMAFNLFLPGGVGGDAYKAVAYSKKVSQPVKRFVLPLLADRIIGLIAILGILSIGLSLIPDSDDWWNSSWFLLSIPVGIPVLYVLVRKWFTSYLPTLFPGLIYSIIIQLVQLIGIGCIALSVGYEGSWWVLGVVFLISTLATAIPVFLGGLGAREIVFAALFPVFLLSSEQGVLISVLFSMIMIASSLPGLLLSWRQRLD